MDQVLYRRHNCRSDVSAHAAQAHQRSHQGTYLQTVLSIADASPSEHKGEERTLEEDPYDSASVHRYRLAEAKVTPEPAEHGECYRGYDGSNCEVLVHIASFLD